jgi:hypothetical protein
MEPENHEEAVSIVSDFSKLPRQDLEYAFTKEDYYRSPDFVPDTDILQANVDRAIELGLIKEGIKAANHVDLSLIQEARVKLEGTNGSN